MEGITTRGGDRKPSGVTERLGLEGLDYTIPAASNRLQYMLGGLTAFFLLVLIGTGLYLAQFYDPTPEGAYGSVRYIITRAPLGDWVRSIHFWSSGAVAALVVAHVVVVFWRRAYRRPREVQWWAGVGLIGLLFLLLVTGTALRYDQEGFEALAHFVTGGRITGPPGRFFTEDFTLSTSLLARIFSLHTSLLPLALLGLMGLHFWLVRQLGISVRSEATSRFSVHLRKLLGVGLVLWAVVALVAALFPEGLGYPAVPGAEITKPFWPLLWVYGLENLLGAWGMVLGPSILLGFLALVPVLDRDRKEGPSWVTWVGVAMAVVIVGLWLYGALGAVQQHIGM